jgi:hypothetical protein
MNLIAGFHTITACTEEYLGRAKKLKESGLLHGIDIEVIKIDTIHRSISPKGNASSGNYKAALISEKIRETGLPVLWLDSDLVIEGSLHFFDAILREGADLAIYNWFADETNAALKPLLFKNFMGSTVQSDRYFEHSHEICFKSSKQLLCSGAVQLWANSYRSLRLLEEWGGLAKKHPRCQDDHLLDASFNYSNEVPKLHSLSKTHCRYAFWPHIKPTINHPDYPHSGGDWEDTAMALNKQRFKISKTTVRPSNRMVPDGMVWDQLTFSLRSRDLTQDEPLDFGLPIFEFPV